MTKRINVGSPEDGEGDELLDKLYVAQWLGISVGMVDELRRRKKLQAIKVGRGVRFERDEVKRYLKGEREGGDGAGPGRGGPRKKLVASVQ
jgi:excisionase family DNA binding protein